MKCCGLIWGIMAGLAFSACLGPRSASTATGGEVTGVGGTAYSEPTPYGMVFVKKGSLKIGTEETDSLWGMTIPTREISVDGFWMDANEVSNAKYRQFVFFHSLLQSILYRFHHTSVRLTRHSSTITIILPINFNPFLKFS